MSSQLENQAGNEPVESDPEQLQPPAATDEVDPVSEVGRRLSLLGRLIVPPSPH